MMACAKAFKRFTFKHCFGAFYVPCSNWDNSYGRFWNSDKNAYASNFTEEPSHQLKLSKRKTSYYFAF